MPGVSEEQLKKAFEQALEPVIQELREIKQQTRSSGGGGIGVSGSAASGGFSRRLSARALGGGAGGAFGNGFAGAAGLRGLGGAAGIAGLAGATVAGAIDAAVVQPAKKIVKDTVFNGLRSGAQFGSEVNPFRGSFTQALSKIPIIGQGVDFVTDPIKKAAQRTAGITTLIARGGGNISSELRGQLFDRFKAEEQRAAQETRKVEKIAARDLGSEETQSAVFAELGAQISRLADSISASFSPSGGS